MNKQPILDSMLHVKFEGTRLVAAIGDFKEWEVSQAVPNIVSACNLFGTYDNVSMAMYTWGYSVSSMGSGATLSAPSIVQSRYPRAAEIMGTALMLKNQTNLCSVFDELIAENKPSVAEVVDSFVFEYNDDERY